MNAQTHLGMGVHCRGWHQCRLLGSKSHHTEVQEQCRFAFLDRSRRRMRRSRLHHSSWSTFHQLKHIDLVREDLSQCSSYQAYLDSCVCCRPELQCFLRHILDLQTSEMDGSIAARFVGLLLHRMLSKVLWETKSTTDRVLWSLEEQLERFKNLYCSHKHANKLL